MDSLRTKIRFQTIFIERGIAQNAMIFCDMCLQCPVFQLYISSRHQRCDNVNKSTVINACRALYKGLPTECVCSQKYILQQVLA